MIIQEVNYTREQVEALLDGGKLQVLVGVNRWWSVRRNGKTKTWKSDPSRWEIPAKAGLKLTFTIGLHAATFRVAP